MLEHVCTCVHVYDNADTVSLVFRLSPPRVLLYNVPTKIKRETEGGGEPGREQSHACTFCSWLTISSLHGTGDDRFEAKIAIQMPVYRTGDRSRS